LAVYSGPWSPGQPCPFLYRPEAPHRLFVSLSASSQEHSSLPFCVCGGRCGFFWLPPPLIKDASALELVVAVPMAHPSGAGEKFPLGPFFVFSVGCPLHGFLLA